MIQAIIYCRFSPRPDADTSTSNDRQEERCMAYCARKGYQVVGVCADRNTSGGVFYERPELQKALTVLQSGMVFVVDSVDRLTRDQLVTVLVKQAVKEAGATIEYADGTPPSTTPEGELVEGILGAVAQFQRSTIRKKTKAGLDRKRSQGIVGGRAPIGYRRANGKLVEDEKEQAAIAEIMQQYSLGYSPIGIWANLDLAGRLIRGRAWQERTIRRIIAREKDKENGSLPCD